MALARESHQRLEHSGSRTRRETCGSNVDAKDYSRKERRRRDRTIVAAWMENDR